MLMLSRRVGESFKIGDNIEVVLVDIRGNQAKIGIDAPKEIPIIRDDAVNKKPGGN